MDQQSLPLVASAITGACTVAGSSLIALISFLASRKKEERELQAKEIAKLKKALGAAYRQIAAFHTLEDEYSSEIERLVPSGDKKHQIKIKFRDKVVGRNFERPDWSANEALKAEKEILA